MRCDILIWCILTPILAIVVQNGPRVQHQVRPQPLCACARPPGISRCHQPLPHRYSDGHPAFSKMRPVCGRHGALPLINSTRILSWDNMSIVVIVLTANLDGDQSARPTSKWQLCWIRPASASCVLFSNGWTAMWADPCGGSGFGMEDG